MFNLFSKPDPKEQQRQTDRALRKAGRDVERDRRELEREEKKLESEIKRLAKEGNNDGCKILAKQLVQLRKQKNRTFAVGSKIQGMGTQSKAMVANVKLAEAMGTAAKTMTDANRSMKPEKIAADLNAFTRESMKMDMIDETINDTLDDILDESGDEEETDKFVTQVLDEIGIEINGKLRTAPSYGGKIGESSKAADADAEIEAVLAKLKTAD